MMDWSGCGSSLARCNKIRAIHAVFDSDERLLQFLFHHMKAELRASPTELIEEARVLSCGEFLLVKVALDLWCGQGGATISELLSVLDDQNLIRLMRAICILREWVEVEEALACCD